MENKEKVIIPDFVERVEVESKESAKNKINEARDIFLKTHQSVMKTNKISSAIFFIITIAMVLLGSKFQEMMAISFVVVCILLGFLWLFTKTQRRKLEEAVSGYLYVYSLYCNSFIFDGDEISDLQIGYKQKPDVEIVKKLNISDEVSIINSRDLIKGEIDGVYFEAFDASLKTGNPRKEREQKALFVGKIFMLNYTFYQEGRTFAYLKGCGDATPTKLADVNKVDVEGLNSNWEIYTSHKNYGNIFTKELTKILNKFECNETMNDLVISIVDDKVLIGFSYSDEAMVIPMNRDFETKHLEIKKDNSSKVREIIAVLEKNSHFKK